MQSKGCLFINYELKHTRPHNLLIYISFFFEGTHSVPVGRQIVLSAKTKHYVCHIPSHHSKLIGGWWISCGIILECE
jgi:hypothetical protein